MSDAPETIWAVHWNTEGAVVNGAWADTIRHFCGGIEYRRADMPITTSQIMADERVKALVKALKNADRVLRCAADYWDNFCNDAERAPYAVAADQARAALAQLKEPKP